MIRSHESPQRLRGLQFRRSSAGVYRIYCPELSLARDARYISLKLRRLAVLRFRSTIKLIWLSIRLVCIKADGPTTFSRPHWIVVKAGRTSCIRALAHTRDESSSLLYIRMYSPLCLLGRTQMYADQCCRFHSFSSKFQKKRRRPVRRILSSHINLKMWIWILLRRITRISRSLGNVTRVSGNSRFRTVSFCHSCVSLSTRYNFTTAYIVPLLIISLASHVILRIQYRAYDFFQILCAKD